MGAPQKGRADYLALGDFNAACSMCGRKRKASQMVRNWQGLFRCPEHNEPRQPQDFARGIKEVISPPWAQIETDSFITFTPTLPVTIFPVFAQLLLGSDVLVTETTNLVIDTESGIDLAVEAIYIAVVSVILPSWVIPASFSWSWKSGGVGILIASPTSSSTAIQTLTTPSSGILQCTVTDSLGGVGVATVAVST